MNIAHETLKQVNFYLEQDWKSYKHVFDESGLTGKLGVALILNAVSALDLYSFALREETGVGDRVKALIDEFSSVFSRESEFPKDLVYVIVRCGVAHQFFPKTFLPICAVKSSFPFVEIEGQKAINGYGFYDRVRCSLKEIFELVSDDELRMQSASGKIESRQMNELSSIDLDQYDWENISVNLTTTTTPSLTSTNT